MSKQGLLSYISIMSLLFAISVGYNACSENANFQAPNGFDEVNLPSVDETITAPQAIPLPSIVINNGAEYTREADVNLTLATGSAKMKQMLISEDEYCRSGVWEDFKANKAWRLGSTNAEAAVYVMYRNREDDAPTDCVKDSIIHDDVPPEVNYVTQVANGWLNEANLDVVFEATDNFSGINLVWCANNGSGVFNVCKDSVNFSNMSENLGYELLVEAIDKAGNRSPKVPLNWKVDLTPPTVSFILTPAATTADVTPDFSYIGFDAGSGVAGYECRLDAAAAFVACPSSQTLSGLADGPHTLYVRAIDNVGFISSEISYMWVQDTSAPTIEFTKTPPPITNNPDALFEFRGLDGGVAINSFECKTDNGIYMSCTSPYTIPSLNDGMHTFSVIGIDMAGNRSAAITYNWLIDTVKPTISFVKTPPAVTKETTANFQVNAVDNVGGSGIDYIECQLDNGGYQQCNNTFSFQGLAEGNHTVAARSVDRAGNISDVITYTWMIDNTKPTVQITSHPNNPTNSSDADFAFVGNDGAGSGIAKYECRIDGDAYAACSSPKSFNGLSEGAHTFYVRAYDNAGNVSDAATYQWTIDQTGPVIAFVKQPDPKVFVGDNASILFRISDDSGVASYVCTLNGMPQACTVDSQLDLMMTIVSSYTFVVVATDTVGNQSTATITWNSTYDVKAYQSSLIVDQDRPVDILFIIDNSGSMAYERSSLAQRLDGFIGKIDGLDWQISVISTDVDSDKVNKDGRFIEMMGMNGTYIIDSSMNQMDAQTALGTTIQNFPGGSGAEQGIWATKRTIDRYIAGNALQQQFFREGADFAAIILSDEDENSEGTNIKISVNNFVNFVNDTWDGKKNFTWHSIIARPGDTACFNFPAQSGYSASAGKYHYAGDIYYDLSTVTNGIIGSVCELDYTTQLESIGQSVKDMQKTATLDCEPVDTTGDGKVDLLVKYKAAGATNYLEYSGTYVIQGVKVVFDDFLPPGDYQFDYSCVAK